MKNQCDPFSLQAAASSQVGSTIFFGPGAASLDDRGICESSQQKLTTTTSLHKSLENISNSSRRLGHTWTRNLGHPVDEKRKSCVVKFISVCF